MVITAVLSAFNSGLFSTGRMLYNLALQNNAPIRFSKLRKSGIPIISILFSSAVLLMGVYLNYVIPAQVFGYVTSIATIAAISAWTIILLDNCNSEKFRLQIERIAFKLPFYPYSSYIPLAFMAFIVIIAGYMPETRTALYVTPIWLLILFIGYKFRRKEKPVQTKLREAGK